LVIVPNTFVVDIVDATPPDKETLVDAGVVQLYKVPTGIIFDPPIVGVTLNGVPVHTVVFIFDTNGFGLTYTVTVNAAPDSNPLHDPNVGVTIYVAVRWAFTLLVNVPLTVV
jgi:hypothetical protein